MVTTTAVEFQRKVGEFQHHAQKEPVEITRHGRREFVLMSAEQYDWMRAVMKRSHRTEETPEVIIKAIRSAKMHPRHNHLNKLLAKKK
jgi:prevent-host-death family protein